jgi:soluble lytic murein transglycosylase-like protein
MRAAANGGDRSVSRKRKVIDGVLGVACAGALCIGATHAAGAPASDQSNPATPRKPIRKLAVLDRPAARFGRAAEVHREHLRAVERRRARESAEAAPAASTTVASPEQYGVSQSTLDAIAACESGGDPAAVSADGTYRGKYQFDYGTWASLGGSGDPAAAPEAEQDMRAAILYTSSGSSPWPICG